jgi:hypothetical protein
MTIDLREQALAAYEERNLEIQNSAILRQSRLQEKTARRLEVEVQELIPDSRDGFILPSLGLSFWWGEYTLFVGPTDHRWRKSYETLADLGEALDKLEAEKDMPEPPKPTLMRYGQVLVEWQDRETRPFKVLTAFGDQDGNAYLIVEYTDLD